jgi:pyruvate dehydrogenase E2 component (dihydrolipoamide acetyltransferase)
MSVSVSMPQLGESVTEGTVTRWLKQEGERVEADEPLLEVSTDKVDTEIPSPVSGILRGITVAEDETVAVGAELAIIDEEGAAASLASPAASAPAAAPAAEPEAPAPAQAPAAEAAAPAAEAPEAPAPALEALPPAPQAPAAQAQAPVAANGYGAPSYQEPYQQQAPPPAAAYQPEPPQPQQPAAEAPAAPQEQPAPAAAQEQPAPAAVQEQPAPAAVQEAAPVQEPEPRQPAGTQEADGVGPQLTSGADGPYVTPLVRKLAAEHGIDLGTVTGTGVGGRIRKQDVLDAARTRRGTQEPQPVAVPQQAGPPPEVPQQAAAPAAAPPAAAPAAPAAAPAAAPRAATAPAADTGRPAIVPSSLRGRTEKLSRSRQVIAQRMVESLQTSAQLTTVVEADVTAIARLRDRAKAGFEAREGVKLSFLPFFALATVEALKVHPKLNAIIDTADGQVTYHDAEHLGIAVDTERGLMVPVIRKAGDLNIAGLARKIADLAARTRAGQVGPDDLSGGTFTLTNTGSRGALFDTPIINQPQVGILGTGTVVKRAVVVEDPALGEVIAVRSMVYLALTYDHRLVDGADAARFLVTIKERLEEGAFETELGL